MSSGARWMLGITSLLFAGGFAYAAANEMVPKNVWLVWLLAAVSALIAVSCVPGKHVAVSGRVVAGAVFALCAWYVVSELLHPDPGGSRSTPGLKNAISLFILWGLPAGFVTVFGFYPKWARLGRIFGRDKT